MNLQPKNRFQKTSHSKPHASLVVSDSFQIALEAALAQMQLNQPNPVNPASAWDSGSKMAGAREFIGILLNLSEPEAETRKLPDKNLKPQ